MASIATMAMLNAKCFSLTSPPSPPKQLKPAAAITLLSPDNLPRGLTAATKPYPACIAAAGVFAALSYSDAAFAAQQIADIAEGDTRGIALLLPIVPAIAWVLFNILQPALNQLSRMRSNNAVTAGLGIGGALAAGGWLSDAEASAGEMAMIAADAAAAAAPPSDSRGLLLLFVVAPAILWVLYNILQPALNQLNRMKSD